MGRKKKIIKTLVENFPVKLPDFKVKRVIYSLSQITDWGLLQQNIPATWKVTKGQGINVFVIDTGLAVHPDLGTNSILGKNCIPYEDAYDHNGHQSHCTGIICARNNFEGMVGVAPEARVVAVKALDGSGSGDLESITNALQFCLDAAQGKFTCKPDLISMSLGAPVEFGDHAYNIIKELYKLNIPIICAAGNSGDRGVDYPGKYPETIAIAAYDKNGNIANFSAKGPEVDFAAPGVDVYSTWTNNSYAKISGTCIKKGSKVFTTRGPVNIEEITTNDKVYSLNEETLQVSINNVLENKTNGIQNIHEIRTTHSIIHATDNHPFLVAENNNLVWKQLKDIECNDKIAVIKQIPECSTDVIDEINRALEYKHKELSCMLKLSNNMPEQPIKVSKEMCQFIGAFLGDGYIHTNRRCITGLTGLGLCIFYGYKQQNKHLPTAYKELFDKSFGIEIDITKDEKQLFIYSEYIANIFKELDLFKTTYTKRIPDWMFRLPDEYKMALLSGIIDSDGWIGSNGCFGVELCNYDLICDIKMLINMLGVKAVNVGYKCVNTKFKQNSESYFIYSSQIKRIEQYLTFYDLAYKKHLTSKCECKDKNVKYMDTFRKAINDTDISLESVTDIIDLQETDEVFDLTIENNHNFIVDGVVVHNSMACPFIAGVTALLLSKHKLQELETGINDCQTVEQIREHFKKYCIDRGAVGKDNAWGFGIIDVPKLIEAEATSEEIPPVETPPPTNKTLLERILDLIRKIVKK